MKVHSSTCVCLVPRLEGVGGMVSFRRKMVAGLRARGVGVVDDLEGEEYDAVLVIGGTRQLGKLWRARQRGVRIIQRLDGMNWLHRRLPTGWRHFLRAEYGNFLLGIIRARLADGVIYQSQFARNWWERAHGPTPGAQRVVYNGVDLGIYTPQGPGARPENAVRLLLVEGSLMGGYEQGLASAAGLGVGLAERLGSAHSHNDIRRVEIMVVGRVADENRSTWEDWISRQGFAGKVTFNWTGLVAGERIPEIDRSAHLLYSADLNAACPNSDIEALACGTPVVAFDTGALPELVAGGAGRVVPYGGDPWKLETPDLPALIQAALEILEDQERYRRAARARAEAAFDLDTMVEGYLEVIFG